MPDSGNLLMFTIRTGFLGLLALLLTACQTHNSLELQEKFVQFERSSRLALQQNLGDELQLRESSQASASFVVIGKRTTKEPGRIAPHQMVDRKGDTGSHTTKTHHHHDTRVKCLIAGCCTQHTREFFLFLFWHFV